MGTRAIASRPFFLQDKKKNLTADDHAADKHKLDHEETDDNRSTGMGQYFVGGDNNTEDDDGR
jgi:hypothetical protein